MKLLYCIFLAILGVFCLNCDLGRGFGEIWWIRGIRATGGEPGGLVGVVGWGC